MISGTKSVSWHFFALLTMAGKLYRYVPRLWTNLIPHIDNKNLFYYEVAEETRKWLVNNTPLQIKQTSKSIHWSLTENDIFKIPKCIIRIKHLVEIKFFKILHECKLPCKIFDTWFVLAHFGLNTRSRTGENDEGRKCLFCNQSETTNHLFTSCQFYHRCLNEMIQQVLLLTGKQLQSSYDDIVYLKDIMNIPYDIEMRTKVVRIIGAYIWSVWSARNMTIGRYRTPDSIVPSRIFSSCMKNI